MGIKEHRKVLNILVIEDDELIRLELVRQLEKFGKIQTASKKSDALNLLENLPFDLAFIDLEINQEMVGFQFLEVCQRKAIYSVILSAHGNDKEFLKKCYGLGCKEFLRKPHTEEGVGIVMGKFFGQVNSMRIKEFIRSKYITQDEKIIKSFETIENLYQSKSPIFISGPSGTGKQVIAEIIHDLGHKTRENFISINCAEFNESLLESELFGHLKGAFTGAEKNKVGRLKLADGGTLFLDEIGTMSLSMQNKLIKAIEEKTFVPVGGTSPLKSDFKLIAATSSDLYEQVGKGKFRLDFLYRINGSHIKLPPLSDRRGDILLLINTYIKNLSSRRAIELSNEAMSALENYNWYGNVRELKALVDTWDSNGVWEVNLGANLPN